MITVEFLWDLKNCHHALALSTAEPLSGDVQAGVSGEIPRQQVPEPRTKAKVTLPMT